MSKISYTKTIGEAWDLTRSRLFQPFNLVTWLTVGFAAWLATLGQRSSSIGFNLPLDRSQFSDPSITPARMLEQATQFVSAHLLAIGLIASVILGMAFALAVLLIWLSSRGKFIFLYNLTRVQPAIQVPWNRFAPQAASLFRWRLVYALITFVFALVFAGTGIALLIPCLAAEQLLMGPAIGLFSMLMVFLLYALIISAINMALEDFIVPLMFRRNIRTNAAWRKFFGLIRRYLWPITAYGILKSLLIAGFFIAFFTVYLLTCCLFCCGAVLLALPYINVVVLLPYYVFIKHFNLCFLAQLDPEIDPYIIDE
jgi:hypothetical protein